MKTIKYFAMLLAAVSLFSGCSDDDDLSTQNKNKTKPSVTVTQGTVTDTQFTFTLTASEEAAQYAYVVFEGKDNAAPTAHDIVIDEVSGKLQSDAFNLADAATQTINVACDPDADYQVFAAAITATGLLSEVSELKVYVPDTGIPTPVSFNPSGNTVTVTYSEDIVVGSTGKATVRYIQWGLGNILAAVEIPAENISTDGNVATIVCPKPGNGAGYIVSYTAGMFEDASGNKCLAMNSGWDNNAGKYVNIGWDDDTVDFAIEDNYFVPQPDDADYNTPTTTIDFAFPFDVYDAEAKNAVQVIFNEAEGISYLNAAYTLEADKRTVKVTLPKVPTATFDVQVAKGAFYDVWGNESAPFTVATDQLRYSNFQVAIKEGDYTISYTAGTNVVNTASGTPFSARLVKYDNTHYALYADWFNAFGSINALPTLLGEVDYANNQIVFDGTFLLNGNPYSKPAFGMGFYDFDQEGTMMLVFWGGGNSGTDPVTAQFDEDGYLTAISYFDYTIHNAADGKGLAVYDACADGTMTYVPAQEAGAPAQNIEAAQNYQMLSTPLAGFKK
ncbi:hypothetical protein [uncultured Alistipes sp.]|uniref:hypothetical protein n=1 Tax=uncultured Alistipes sp. TaxID=538949 RepID=UPI00262754BD|nr:hypothetical protein [uncultured Alistipes sp.]